MTTNDAPVDGHNDAHVFRSWPTHGNLQPLAIEKSQGSTLWDTQGRSYLDFVSQWMFSNIGHQHPKLIEAIRNQLDDLAMLAPSYVSSVRGRAAEAICRRMPDHLNQVFFTMGGGDANEHAIRMARLFTQRYKVLSSYFSYHGSTPLALAVSGDQRRWPLDMAISGSVRFYTPYLFRSRFYATDAQQEAHRALSHLEDQIKNEGPDTIAAILIEPIGTAFGALVPPAEYLAGVRALCDRYGILLIFDEVASGFGRTGEWFAMDHYGVEPDLVTLGKGLTGGYAPLGCVVISQQIAAHFKESGYPAVPTYSAHPLGCAAVIANIDVIEEEGIVAHAKHMGETLIGPRLEEMKTRFSHIGEIRGVGAYWSLELVEDPDSRTPLSFTTPSGEQIPATTELARICRTKGLLVGSKSTHTTVAPPCNASSGEVTRGLSILEEALAIVDPRNSAHTP